MHIKICGLIFTAFCFSIFNVAAQIKPPDSLLYSDAAIKVIGQFNASIGMQSEVYNGAAYDLYPSANKGTFYFEDKNYCTPSLIRYDNTWYKNFLVLYDVYHDAMVTTSDSSLFILNDRKVSDVYLLDHHFIFLKADESSANMLPGYYDELYDGNSKVLVKRTKLIDETKTTEVVYEDKSDVYVKKGGQYYLVNSRSALLDLFKDKKKLLNQYLSDNKIRYNNDKEGSAAKLASYYDQISK